MQDKTGVSVPHQSLLITLVFGKERARYNHYFQVLQRNEADAKEGGRVTSEGEGGNTRKKAPGPMHFSRIFLFLFLLLLRDFLLRYCHQQPEMLYCFTQFNVIILDRGIPITHCVFPIYWCHIVSFGGGGGGASKGATKANNWSILEALSKERELNKMKSYPAFSSSHLFALLLPLQLASLTAVSSRR